MWIGSRAHGTALAVAIIVGVLASAFLTIAFGAGLGILAGGAVALERRMPRNALLIGVALFVAIVVVGDLPFVGALMTPLP